MNCPFYRVFVGKFNNWSETKNDTEKLRKIGLTPSVFKYGDGYSILVVSALKQQFAEDCLTSLIKKGFDAFIDEPKK